MAFFENDGVPKVTAAKGTREWEAQVVAYTNWLDDCYQEADPSMEEDEASIEDCKLTPDDGMSIAEILQVDQEQREGYHYKVKWVQRSSVTRYNNCTQFTHEYLIADSTPYKVLCAD